MTISTPIDPRLLQSLRCPETGSQLRNEGGFLVSADGSRRYPVLDGIPCLIPDTLESTHAGYRAVIEQNRSLLASDGASDEAASAATIQAMLVATCGNLFRGTILRDTYPIPDLKGCSFLGGSWTWAVTGGAGVSLVHLRATL